MWWLAVLLLLVLVLVVWLVHRRLHVVISRYKEDVNWKKRLFYSSTVYEKETGGTHSIPYNKGNEASVYFKYIVDNYHALPEYTVFVHGHESDWHHSQSIVDTIHSLNLQNGYANINDTKQRFELTKDSNGFIITDYVEENQIDRYPVGNGIEDWWKENMEEYFGTFDEKVASDTCCAQFVVSRNAILQHPLSFYEKQYNWLITTDVENRYSGRFYEWTWKYIFTYNSQS
jgi:hypothetical protein